MSLKILHLNYNDKKGGAAIAVNRIHECLKKVGVISKVLVAKKTDDDEVCHTARRFYSYKSQAVVVERWSRRSV